MFLYLPSDIKDISEAYVFTACICTKLATYNVLDTHQRTVIYGVFTTLGIIGILCMSLLGKRDHAVS